ncbi:MAG: hypothetical protein ACRDPS_09205 [Nocardioides sp.]|uniref:hypothetical protein n=1 Tax=Nocardioides sp. TaxID=35761 RepID=UPI003D6AB85A
MTSTNDNLDLGRITWGAAVVSPPVDDLAQRRSAGGRQRRDAGRVGRGSQVVGGRSPRRMQHRG